MKSKCSRRQITRRGLLIFTLVVLLSGWIGEGLNVLTGSPSEESPGMLIWLMAPLAAVICLRTFGDGWGDAGLKPLFKRNVRWYITAIILFPVLTLTVIFVGAGLGWISFTNFDTALFLKAFVFSLLPNFVKNIPEEFVWRGYLTPKLASLKIKDFVLYLIVGFIWGIWHVPYYLFFLSGETLQSFTSTSMELFIPLSILTMIAWSIVFVELWFLTGSVWPAVILHTVEDSFINPLVLNASFSIAEGKDMLIHPVSGIFSILLFILVGLKLRQVRHSNTTLVTDKCDNVL